MLLQVQPGAVPSASLPDSAPATVLGGKAGEAVIAELHGKYYTQNYRGRLWHASIFTASAIPLFATNATPNFFVFNPPNNPNNIVLTKFKVGFVGGTGIAGAIGYAYISGVNALTGTAAAVSAATTLTIQGGKMGAGYTGQAVAGSAATVTGAAPYALTMHSNSNLSQGAPITTTAAAYSLFEDFDGTMILPPGTLWCPVGITAIAETVVVSISAYEAPI